MLKRHNKNSNSSSGKSYSPLRKVCSAHRKTYSRKISCFSIAGICCKLSGVCLLLLTFLLISPTTTSASALEAEESSDGANYDDQISAQSTTISTVNISFSPTSGSASLTPTSASGASALISIKATVGVENSGGYVVYLGSTSSALTGKTTSQTVPSLSSATAYDNLPVNTWGYNATETTTAPANPTLSAMPANTRGVTIGSNSSTSIKSDSKTFQLSFAANIGPDKPADTYENQVTLSVISSPLEITNEFGIETMQEMSASICAGVAANTSDQLRDTRDGKYYWVTKLADGKCWMTQNLDLDLSTSKPLTPNDSDVSVNWTPSFNTATQAASGTVNSGIQTETRSWSLGNYRITKPTESSSCGYPKNDLSQCATQFTAYNTPTTQNKDENAHYIVGNHYQWNAATAGTGGSIISGQAISSICPKGWKLPESNVTTAGSFGGLTNAYSIGSNVIKLTSSPLYFVRGGYVHQLTSYLFYGAGSNGNYWSSTPSSDASRAYYLDFSGTNSVAASASDYRAVGRSVRCIAR